MRGENQKVQIYIWGVVSPRVRVAHPEIRRYGSHEMINRYHGGSLSVILVLGPTEPVCMPRLSSAGGRAGHGAVARGLWPVGRVGARSR